MVYIPVKKIVFVTYIMCVVYQYLLPPLVSASPTPFCFSFKKRNWQAFFWFNFESNYDIDNDCDFDGEEEHKLIYVARFKLVKFCALKKEEEKKELNTCAFVNQHSNWNEGEKGN